MPRHVALLIETSNDYARGLLYGIRAYIREHGSWSLYLGEHGRGDRPPTWLAKWKGDGIIARIENRAIAKAVVASGLPVVDVSAARIVPEIPFIETYDTAIAKLAAEHLFERGFRHFAYCGDPRFNWSKWRGEEFTKIVRAAGHICHVYQTAREPKGRDAVWDRDERSIAKWIAKLPRPVGIMACYDIRGRQVLDACRRLNVHVPDEVAVIGVDDDELLCELADPPLSSVAPDTHRTGYAAAQMLDAMMSGRKAGRNVTLIEPIGVVARRSTDVLAIEDRDVSAAVRFIRQHACEGIGVEDVLSGTTLSRRVLESRFRKLIGRTPHEEISRVQLDRVKELLRETDLPLARIAQRCGFKHSEYLSAVFRKKLGVTTSAYRAGARK